MKRVLRQLLIPGMLALTLLLAPCQAFAAGNDGLVASLDGNDVVGVVGSAEFPQGLVENFAVLPELDGQHDECAAVHVPALSSVRC